MKKAADNMKKTNARLQSRTAKALMALQDPDAQRYLVKRSSLILFMCIAMYLVVARSSIPVKLPLVTLLGIAMGMGIVQIMSYARFHYVGKYINWNEVKADANLPHR